MYRQTIDPNIIERIADTAFIPRDPANRDYQEFLKWEAGGGVILPYVPPTVPLPPEEFLSRNRLINSDMRIDAANQGAVVTVNATGPFYSVDMFKGLGMPTAGVFTLQRLTATPPAGFTHYLRAACTVANATIAASDLYTVRTSIEGINLTDFRLGTPSPAPIALSFWVRSSLAGIYSGSIVAYQGGASYVFEYAINAADTWEKKVITLPGPKIGVWPSDRCMDVQFNLAVGSAVAGAAGAWLAGKIYGSPNQVNFMSSNTNRTFDLTAVQLEPGLTATAYKYRPISNEQTLAMRYLQIMGGVADASLAMLQNVSTSVAIGPYRFPVVMRSAPTATIKNPTHFNITNRNNGPETVQTFGVDTLTPSGCRLVISVSGGQSAGFASSLMCGAFADAIVLFDARI